MSTLRADRIEKSYGPHSILAGVSLSVSARDRIGIVGANGTGRAHCSGSSRENLQMPDG